MPAKVFISYAREDRVKVRKLYRDLAAAGFTPWLDEEDILPGQDWENAINQAMKESDFVILCLSKTSVVKQSYVQTEMKNALALFSQYPQDTVYLIPARLDDCPIPKSLERRQSADLFSPNGLKKVIKALQFEISKQSRQPAPKQPVKTAFNDIGFSIDAETRNSVERLQFAEDQLQPHLQSILDAHRQLNASSAQMAQLSSRWQGRIDINEIIARLEYLQQINDAQINVMEANVPLVNFLGYSQPDVGIGPGNVDAVRNDFDAMVQGTPELIASTTRLMKAIEGAPWLPADIRDPLIATTGHIQTQASLVQRKIASLGVI